MVVVAVAPGVLVVVVLGQGSLASLASLRVVSLAIASLASLLSHPFFLALALVSSSLMAVVEFNNRTDKVCISHGSLEVRPDGSSTSVISGRT